MAPIDYNINVQSPFQAAAQGFQLGNAVQEQMQARQASEAALQQQAVDAERQKKLEELRSMTMAQPTAQNFSNLMLADPKSSEGIKRAWDISTTDQQQSLTADLLKWGAAIKSGKPEIAAAQLDLRADDIEKRAGAPTRESQALRAQAAIAKDEPEFALGQIQAMLAASPMGKDAAETLAKFGTEKRADQKAPFELKTAAAGADKAASDAVTAAVGAKYANSNALSDLEKKGWDIKKIVADIGIAQQANRISAMNAAIAREGNSLKRKELELKVAEAQNKFDSAIREKAATAQTGAASIDNMLNTLERIKLNPGLDGVLGPIQGRMPGLSKDGEDAVALIETVVSQAFLAQIPNIKGMGALSNAEGEKLQQALQNFSRPQSEKQFRANLDEASRLLNKGRKVLETSSGIPLGKPDTPAAPGARPPLSSFGGNGGASASF